jgi:hypothetical protein
MALAEADEAEADDFGAPYPYTPDPDELVAAEAAAVPLPLLDVLPLPPHAASRTDAASIGMVKTRARFTDPSVVKFNSLSPNDACRGDFFPRLRAVAFGVFRRSRAGRTVSTRRAGNDGVREQDVLDRRLGHSLGFPRV